MGFLTGPPKRRTILALGAGAAAAASTIRSKVAEARRAAARDETCGEEMARGAEVPEQLAALWAHVADNMEAHARWTDATATGAAESMSLIEIARHYRTIVEAAGKAAVTMRAMEALPPARHESQRIDMPALQAWMRKKIGMQRAFARLLLRHARQSEAALEKMRPRDAKDLQNPR